MTTKTEKTRCDVCGRDFTVLVTGEKFCDCNAPDAAAKPVDVNAKQIDVNAKQIDGDHYKKMKMQPWEIIEAHNLDYFEGAALKYLLRWKTKDGILDVQKCIHYCEKIIERYNKGAYGDIKPRG